MAKKKSPSVPLYTDLARPQDTGQDAFEAAAAKQALDGDAEASTYTSSGPGQVEQELGKIK